MTYKYTHFIPQNTALKGAKEIGVYNDKGEKICSIHLGRLTPTTKEKLYSFGLVSDTHMAYDSYTDKNDPATVGLKTNDGYGFLPNGTKLRRALEFMNEQGVDFCCNCGDMTNNGFYNTSNGEKYYYPYQFQEYRDICSLFPDMPMYNVCGNHESYNMDISESLDDLETYTGNREIAFHFKRNNDVFIFVGQSKNTVPMTDTHLQWLIDRLIGFKDNRCFLFVHSFIDENWKEGEVEEDEIQDSGNPCDARNNSIFGYWEDYYPEKLDMFLNALKAHPNLILFHGHSHIKFEAQEFSESANYTENNGFKSIHIPSSADPRSLLSQDGTWEADRAASQGYIVDVYDDCIVLNGMNFINKKPVPLGVYKIDTTLQTIEANTFTDSTGTITT